MTLHTKSIENPSSTSVIYQKDQLPVKQANLLSHIIIPLASPSIDQKGNRI